MLERHRLDEAESVFLVETDDGILITRQESAFANALKVAERDAKKYQGALRKLGE
jgi:hypothetical protein